MKKTKLVYTRRIEDENGARIEKFKVKLTEKFTKDFTSGYTSYKLRCLTSEDLKNIWINNEEDLSCELCRDEILDVQEDLKGELIEYDPVEIVKLDDEDYGEWEQIDDECFIEETETKEINYEELANFFIDDLIDLDGHVEACRKLFYAGLTKEQISSLGFDKEDIDEAKKEYDEENN